MKKLLLLTSILSFNGFVYAQDYKITSEITEANQIIGSPVLVVKEGKTATLQVGEQYKFSVNVKPEGDSQVLLDLTSKQGEFERSTHVVFDLDKKLQLKLGEQSFKFIINKVSS
ncbi:hypothetical protein V6260_13655 [Pseudoalteromonas aliena]|uniref:hypothetical protein n=1 Tax=Pseudoalteromonas aliena TaxID=247523 RepID=UPI00311E4DCF